MIINADTQTHTLMQSDPVVHYQALQIHPPGEKL